MRDPGNVPHTVHNLHVTVRDMNSHPPNPAMARKLMSDSVGNAQPMMLENLRNNVLTVGDYDLQLSGVYDSNHVQLSYDQMYPIYGCKLQMILQFKDR